MFGLTGTAAKCSIRGLEFGQSELGVSFGFPMSRFGPAVAKIRAVDLGAVNNAGKSSWIDTKGQPAAGSAKSHPSYEQMLVRALEFQPMAAAVVRISAEMVTALPRRAEAPA